MKKTLSLLLVLAMVLTSFTAVFAADETEKTPGEILQEIGVLKGNAEGDLMLEKEVSRQDMIVLLSRLLGQEDEAKAFTGETTFKDIEDPYYVPYIAWAQANELTNGVAEGGEAFGFGRSVTQQEVLAFLLRALGYGFDEVEFENVAAKAAELKLIDDAKADLTVASTREVLAELSLKALKTKVKDSDKTLAEKLELTLPEAEKLEVKEVVADNLKEVKVVLNKSVDEESAVDLNNYDLEGEDIEDAVYTAEDHTVILTVKDELENKEDYTLTIDGVKDDKTVLDVSKDFTALDNAVPEVVEVVGLGTKAVKVVMSEPINGAKASSFKIDGKTVSGTIQAAGRDIIVKTYSAISVGDHELTVGQLKDYNDFKSVESKHSFTVVEDKDAPEVSDAVATALERVVLTFSEDVDSTTVNTKTVYWKNGSTKVYPEEVKRLAGNKYAFTFEADDALPVYETTLYITGVKDYSGNTMADAEIAVKPSIDDSRPVVRSVEVEDSKTITVKFSKPVNTEKDGKDSATNSDNYKITDSDDKKQAISTVKESGDSHKVFEINLGKALDEDEDYTIKISGIKDRNKYANYMIDYSESLEVAGINNPSLTAVTVKRSNAKNKDGNYEYTAYLYFDKDMDIETVSNRDNYLVAFKDETNKLLSAIADSEIEVVNSDADIVKLIFESSKDEVKGIAGLGVKDTSGNGLKNYGTVVEPDEGEFKISSVVAKSKTTIKVTFSIPLDRDATDEDAFTISSKDDVSINKNVVTITLDKDLNADPNTNVLTIDQSEVFDYAGNKLGTGAIVYGDNDTINVIGDEISPSLDSLGKAVVNSDSIKIPLIFDEKLDVADVTKWDSDLTVVAVDLDDDPSFTVEKKDPAVNEDTTIIVSIPTSQIDKDTAFLVGVKEDARFIIDASDNENVAEETDPLLRVPTVVIGDQKAVNDEADKYESAVEIPKTVKVGDDVTSLVVKLKANKTANPDVKLSYAVEDNAYLEVKEDGKVYLKAQVPDGTEAQVVPVTITFTKGTQKATLDVNVTIQPQDAKSDSTIIVILDHEVVTGINTSAHTLTVANEKTVEDLNAAIEVQNNGTFEVVTSGGEPAEPGDDVVTDMLVNVTAENGVATAQYAITVQ